jgi:hypothetical protein
MFNASSGEQTIGSAAAVGSAGPVAGWKPALRQTRGLRYAAARFACRSRLPHQASGLRHPSRPTAPASRCTPYAPRGRAPLRRRRPTAGTQPGPTGLRCAAPRPCRRLVAQAASLPYRGLIIRRRAALPTASRRYSRLPIGATPPDSAGKPAHSTRSAIHGALDPSASVWSAQLAAAFRSSPPASGLRPPASPFSLPASHFCLGRAPLRRRRTRPGPSPALPD